MTGLRRLLTHQRWIAACLLAAALVVRVLVPAGYMPARPGSLALTICSGHMAPATMAMPGMGKGDHGRYPGDRDGADQPCPFAGLAMPSLAGADVAFVVAAVPMSVLAAPDGRPDTRAPPQNAFLRPPLRGPPSLG